MLLWDLALVAIVPAIVVFCSWLAWRHIIKFAKFIFGLANSKEGMIPVDRTIDFPAFHVVFIHGFTGNAVDTWTNYKPYFSFPTEIRRMFPAANVWSYQYPSGLVSLDEKRERAFGTCLETVLGQSKKPIIIVAHSQGGLITKHTLCLLNNNPMSEICRNIAGVIFYATPHFGNNLSKIQRRFNISDSLFQEEIKILGDPARLTDLDNEFAKLELNCHFVVELSPTVIGKIVGIKSAAGGRDSYDGLHYNHLEIVKPSSLGDERFLIAENFIAEHIKLMTLIQVDTYESNLSNKETMMKISNCRTNDVFYTSTDEGFRDLFQKKRVDINNIYRPWKDWMDTISAFGVEPGKNFAFFGNAPYVVFFRLGQKFTNMAVILASHPINFEPQSFLYRPNFAVTSCKILKAETTPRQGKVRCRLIFIKLNPALVLTEENIESITRQLPEEEKRLHFTTISPVVPDKILPLTDSNFAAVAAELVFLLNVKLHDQDAARRVFVFSCPSSLAFVAGSSHKLNITNARICERLQGKYVVFDDPVAE